LTGPVPACTTLWRLLTAVDPTALQNALGAWLRALWVPETRAWALSWGFADSAGLG
jgi:hypothetical protein